MLKLINILLENEKILIPRRSSDERKEAHLIAVQRKIQQYIKSGGKGDLDLSNTPIASLPSGLTVKGSLNLSNTPIARKYSNNQIKNMVPKVKGSIYY